MDVTATVSDLSGPTPKRFLMIQTTGGTNAMPGAIMGVIVWPLTFREPPDWFRDFPRIANAPHAKLPMRSLRT